MPKISPETARKEFLRKFVACGPEKRLGIIEGLMMLHEGLLASEEGKNGKPMEAESFE